MAAEEFCVSGIGAETSTGLRNWMNMLIGFLPLMYRFAPNPMLDNKTVFDYTQVEHCLPFTDRNALFWQARDRQKEKIKTVAANGIISTPK